MEQRNTGVVSGVYNQNAPNLPEFSELDEKQYNKLMKCLLNVKKTEVQH